MANNQPNVDEKDAEFEAIKAKIPFDEEDSKVNQPEHKEAKPEEKKPEVKAPEKKEEAKPIDPPADKDIEPPARSTRPEKYIPIKQYVEEKKEWKGTSDQKDARIAELEKIAGIAEGTKRLDDAVTKYAEKYKVDMDTAREEVMKIKDILDLTAPPREESKAPKSEEDKEPTFSPEQQKLIDEAQEIKARDLYTTEFNESAVPQLKALFPDATDAQLAEAKDEIEKLACTGKYLDKSLDYIAFKEKDALADIFQEPTKGPEPKRPGPRGSGAPTALDFDSGKTPFTALESLSQESRNAIIKDFAPKTWNKYMHWVNTTGKDD